MVIMKLTSVMSHTYITRLDQHRRVKLGGDLLGAALRPELISHFDSDFPRIINKTPDKHRAFSAPRNRYFTVKCEVFHRYAPVPEELNLPTLLLHHQIFQLSLPFCTRACGRMVYIQGLLIQKAGL